MCVRLELGVASIAVVLVCIEDWQRNEGMRWVQRVLDNMPLRPGLTHHSSGPTRSGWVYAQPTRSHSSLPFSLLSVER